MRSRHALTVALLGLALFVGIAAWRAQQPVTLTPQFFSDRVVIPAPLLVALHGGDRFLAADLETMRLAATGLDDRGVDTGYLVRAQREVARLNPCHEDNYYLANGLLTWGGAVEEGNDVLRAAVECRFWDEIPPFFYGINLAFFQRNNEEAARVLEIGAQRSPQNAAAMRKLAVMLRAEQFADERLALNYLIQQRDSAADPKLQDMLDKRVIRLQGLIALREAQRRYEQEHGPLTTLDQLVARHLIESLPTDPLRLGYEIRDGRIELKKLKIAGLEEQP
ncbi:hypothetical protein [Stutzerimonas xanthomarina]|uniref:Uncharacterized protein n=2 Tax=Stutzerimonas xanthomarina TaxID=271420 RepID=A0A1M5K2N7_9GAMM|nr:hypothetical protein [Stutzerimonas xanthomarina]MCP9339758.1 hypothetical protein [Stutzerimonas xanthomarina]SEI04158.1 hypothetical protein SAMN05216535_3642 [Stutzerimonas xanthomarina]SHG47072.1 hypothetical protein SAMN02744645_0246 [Stutzerimonas xanthomarina DSM 18231]